jgi:uncharacterized membrane protein
MRIGLALFAATLIGLGLLGLVTGDFTAIWQPVPRRLPAREALAIVCAVISLGAGAGIVWKRTASAAAGVLTVFLIGWMAAFKGPALVAAPTVAAVWESCGETAVIAAGAWTLFAELAGGRGPLRFVTGEAGLRAARILYGLALLAFGAAHLAYVKATAALVPGWLPWPAAWVRITGLAYLAAGAAIIAGRLARLAATLSAVQMGLFTLLVWAPAIAARGAGADAWGEAVISWTLTAAGWVVADSYGASSGRSEARSRRGG